MEPEYRTGDKTPKKKEHPAHKWYKHLDARWYRNVWWSKRKKSYKPRDPSKGIDWSRPEGWMPETPEEIKERCKIARLQHDEVKLGGIYNFLESPTIRSKWCASLMSHRRYKFLISMVPVAKLFLRTNSRPSITTRTGPAGTGSRAGQPSLEP